MKQDIRVALVGHSSNMLGLPTGLLASADFNENPLPLHIHGTREANSGLFGMLESAQDMTQASALFQDYMSLVFGFEEEQFRGTDAQGRRRVRSSYLRLLQDWGFDSNNPQGAVLKGWVESRFGLFPTFHKAPLEGFATPAWMGYVEEKMNSRYHNNCIFLQLDLLYEFCQWAVARFQVPSARHRTLFRGVDKLDELRLAPDNGGKSGIVRLNNIVSFTDRRETAGEFGRYLLETRVPMVKLLFFNDLLASHPLRGEAEYLAIGGDYRVRISS
ncbi:MAG: dinitrogenase reductase ADP-ribosyltransferase-like protein [Proteobacteria bacterium]|nr:dinitrogenase reductase ADP-ribosyltransferase-like protein [Pseudomonadota bacterium]